MGSWNDASLADPPQPAGRFRGLLQRCGERIHRRFYSCPDVERTRIKPPCWRHRSRHRSEVRRCHIPGVHVVARLLAISEDRHRATVEQTIAEDGYYSGLTVRVLPRAINVAVPKCNGLHAMDAAIVREVVLHSELGDSVG